MQNIVLKRFKKKKKKAKPNKYVRNCFKLPDYPPNIYLANLIRCCNCHSTLPNQGHDQLVLPQELEHPYYHRGPPL